MDIITVRKLKKYYKSGAGLVKALDGVDLTVARGEFVSVMGASGSGKTTLLNIIGGVDMPDEGEVYVDGADLARMGENKLAVFRRRKVGFVFQEYNLIPTLTVEENILFPLDLDGSASYPDTLSGGQKQRVAIARALAAKPPVILADEPTGSLDSRNGQNVAGLLKMTAEHYHHTLVMVTHNRELAQLADRVIYMEDGKIRK